MPRNKKLSEEKYNSPFASRLREAFEEGRKKGLTQAKLAARLGVTAQAVSKWYNGESEPQLSALSEIADYFGTSVDWLVGKEIPKTPDITNRTICGKTGLSGTAIDNLTEMARNSGGNDFWSFALKYLSFLLETYTTSLIQPAIDVSSYIANYLSIKHYTDDVLPKLTPSAYYRKDLFNISDADMEVLANTTKVNDEVHKLKDICAAKRYYCEKGASRAISEFIDYTEKQYKSAASGPSQERRVKDGKHQAD